MWDKLVTWTMRHPRDVAVAGGLAVVTIAAALGAWVVVAAGPGQGGAPLVAEPGPGRSPATAAWPHTSSPPGLTRSPVETGQNAPLEPEFSRAATGSPAAVRTGNWTGFADITVVGQEPGCTAIRRSYRLPATLKLAAPLTGERNVAHLSFATMEVGAEGAFNVVSSVGGTDPAQYWTLTDDGAGGVRGTLQNPVLAPVNPKQATDNVLYAPRGLDEQCGNWLSAPLAFPIASGATLRVEFSGPRVTVEMTGRTSDRTRSIQIVF